MVEAVVVVVVVDVAGFAMSEGVFAAQAQTLDKRAGRSPTTGLILRVF